MHKELPDWCIAQLLSQNGYETRGYIYIYNKEGKYTRENQ